MLGEVFMRLLFNNHMRQSNDNDCGVACLYMLFHYHKKR